MWVGGLAKVQVEAVETGADAVVGSLHQVQTRATGGALIAATADARLAQRRALLTALLIVPEKPRRTLGNARPERHAGRRWKEKGRETDTDRKSHMRLERKDFHQETKAKVRV